MSDTDNNLKFKVTVNGVFCDGTKISDPIKIVGLVKTLSEKNWKTRLQFKDMNGDICLLDLENENIAQPLNFKKELIRKGFCPNIDSEKFKSYTRYMFSNVSAVARYIEANQTGWINETTFLCPSFSVSAADSKDNFFMQDCEETGYALSGTLEEWRDQVADLCQNNSVLTFALCVALAPILLRYFPEIGTTIFHLVGRSSIGKTTALKVAASVWGNPKKYIKQWRATGNAQEGIAEKHNDSLLILDEIGQANDKDIQQTVYMIGNEKGKSRMTIDAALKTTKSWRLLCLSSGEIGISEKIESAGEHVHGGVLVRCVDIEAQSSQEIGIFEDLRGYSNGNEFSTTLAKRTSKYYGTAAKYFVDKIKEVDEDMVRNIFDESLQRIKKRFDLEDSTDGAILRILNAFALINIAGILASSDYIGVLNHNCGAIDEDICNVLRRCLANFKSQEEKRAEIVEDVLQFLQQNRARFRKITHSYSGKNLIYQGDDDRNIKWLGGIESEEGRQIYYIFPNAFKEEICKEKGEKLYRKILKEEGFMLTYGNGENIRYTINNDRMRMVTLCFVYNQTE